jgi:hypothetical protein
VRAKRAENCKKVLKDCSYRKANFQTLNFLYRPWLVASNTVVIDKRVKAVFASFACAFFLYSIESCFLIAHNFYFIFFNGRHFFSHNSLSCFVYRMHDDEMERERNEFMVIDQVCSSEIFEKKKSRQRRINGCRLSETIG